MKFEIAVSGKPGPKTISQVAFDQANGFYECALRCAEPVKDSNDPKKVVSPSTPTITNIAFASELYMKSLIVFNDGKMPETHRLDRLYNSLSQDTQKYVRRRYAELAKVGRLDLKDHLGSFSNAFVDWRYMFERVGEIRIDRMFHLAHSLFDATRAAHPEWEVTAYMAERIEAGPSQMVLSTTYLGGGHFVRTIFVPQT